MNERKLMAAFSYLLGIGLVLYVAVYRYRILDEVPNVTFWSANVYWFVLGIVLVVIAAVLWPKGGRREEGDD